MSGQYFATEPGSPERPRTVSFTVRGSGYELESAAGVFSADRLDPGTAVLLRQVDPPVAGTVLDLGCGYGPIACVLARSAPAVTVWAVDVNRRARELTGRNAERLGVADRVRVVGPAELPADLRFDQVWSNPPVRVGKEALHAELDRALARLTAGGVGWLVVARNLGADSLQRWLRSQGWCCDRYASARGYRVLAVRRPSDRAACG